MSRPEPILPEKESKILLELYENPGKRYDTFYLNDILHFADLLDLPNMSRLIAARETPEYAAAFKETVKTIESLVEKGLIDGEQHGGNQDNWGMYYKELKVKFKGRQVAQTSYAVYQRYGNVLSGIYSFGIFASAFVAFVLTEFDRFRPKVLGLLALGFLTAYAANILRMVLIVMFGVYSNTPQDSVNNLLVAHSNLGWLIFLGWIALFWGIVFRFVRAISAKPVPFCNSPVLSPLFLGAPA